MKYNYLENMVNDIKEVIEYYNIDTYEDREDAEQGLYDEMWCDDSITGNGNGSGSYTFCRATAKKYVLDNMKLCIEALKEFCVEAETVAEKFLSEDWEYFDVTIRCYLLGQAISKVLDEIYR